MKKWFPLILLCLIFVAHDASAKGNSKSYLGPSPNNAKTNQGKMFEVQKRKMQCPLQSRTPLIAMNELRPPETGGKKQKARSRTQRADK